MGWATDSMKQDCFLSAPAGETRTRRLSPRPLSALLLAGVAAICLAGSVVASSPVLAQSANGAANAATGDASLGTAIGLLLEKAQFWY